MRRSPARLSATGATGALQGSVLAAEIGGSLSNLGMFMFNRLRRQFCGPETAAALTARQIDIALQMMDRQH
jgi:hypothetical protein